MSEREHSDMIPYVIAGIVALVVAHLVWRWMRDEYIDAIKNATGGLLFN